MLTAEAGIHRHDQQEIHVGEDLFNGDQRSCRIEGHARFEALFLDELDRAVQMRARLDMDRDIICSRLRELLNEVIGIRDHQMAIEREGRDFANGFDDRRADRQVRDKMSVHHVHVKQIGARLLHGGDLIS